LRSLLEGILPQKSAFEDYEVEHYFPPSGRKVMLLNARELRRKSGQKRLILLAIQDITAHKEAQEQLQAAYQQLQAEEQQLRAANQQLQASEQQLKAVNQQLRANEQQLHAEITERKRAEQELKYRVKFERLITTISSEFISPGDIDDKINRALKAIGEFADVDRAYVFLLREDGKTADNTHEWCAEGIEPQIENLKGIILDDELPWFWEKIRAHDSFHIPAVSDLPAEAHLEKAHFEMQDIQALIVVPMLSNGKLRGFLGFDSVRSEKTWAEEIISLLKIAGENISMSLDSEQAKKKLLCYQSQLKTLASQLTLAEEQERRRIATELHDRISQHLVISKLKLESLRHSISDEQLICAFAEVCDILDHTIQEARSLTFDLSSLTLHELGFEQAVAEWLNKRIEKQYCIATEFEDDKKPKPLSADVSAILFRNIRELLFNVVKHAKANKVKVSIHRIDDRIQICVEDDGKGFEPAEITAKSVSAGAFGLFSVKERLERLEGHLQIESKPGKGCKITMTGPLKQKSG